jgi:hypothetical protein
VILNSVESGIGYEYGYGKGKVKGYYLPEDQVNGISDKIKKPLTLLKK